MDRQRQPFVVVGGGLVGALWSLFLARRGHQVSLYERRPDPRVTATPPGRSTHLVISARGWKAIVTAGAESTVRKFSIPLQGRVIHGSSGKLAFHRYGEEGQSIDAVDRSTLNLALVSLAAEHPNIQVAFNQKCVDANLDRPSVLLEDAVTGERREVESDRLFAADGAFSRVRLSMLRTDRFDYSQHYISYGHKELAMPDGSRSLEANTHVWPRGKVMMIAFPNPGGSFTATLLMPLEGDDSFATIQTPEQVRSLFQSRFSDALPLMPELERDFFANPTLSAVVMRCSPWTYKGRVALLGDSAHAMVPFLGQGMNCGFEDCSVLDELMTEHGDDWPRIFRDYEALRRPNADAVTEMSSRHFTELSELVDDPRFLLQKTIEAKIHRLHPNRFMPLYPIIAFTHTPYTRAREIAAAQEAITRQVMAHPNIQETWDSPEVERLIASLIGDLPELS